MSVTLDLSHNRVTVTFPFDPQVYREVKAIPGARFKKEPQKHWEVPLPQLPEVLRRFPRAWRQPAIDAYWQRVERANRIKAMTDAEGPTGIHCEFWPFQRVAYQFVKDLDRPLLTLGPRLGKTRVGIAWAKDRLPCLVVTPSVTKYQYRNAILEAIPWAKTWMVWGERGYFPRPGEAEWSIINYELLTPRLRQIKEFGFKSAIFSEGHYLKGHPVGTKILTPAGWKSIEHLALSDTVIGSDGKPTRLTGIHNRGMLEVYRVTFNDHTSILVDKGHLWAIKSANDFERKRQWRILSTSELMASRPARLQATGRWKTVWRIPIVKPIEFSMGGPLPIDPYLLGVLLGDGQLHYSGGVRFTAGNPLVTEEMAKAIPPSLKLKEGKDKLRPFRNAKTWYIAKASGRGGGRNAMSSAIRQLGLTGKRAWEKYIPQQYLFSSVSDRLELLRGLMDTDGTRKVSLTGSTVFNTTSPKLAEHFRFLVETLGGQAWVPKPYTTHYTYKGVRKSSRPALATVFRLPAGVNPYRVYANKYVPRIKHREPVRTIRNIQPNSFEEVICLSVEAQDGLYVTENCVVTHNSGSQSQRGVSALEISEAVPSIMLETATPMPNRPEELIPLLRIMRLLTDEDDWDFKFRYCLDEKEPKIKINRKGETRWNFKGSRNLDELHALMAPQTFRKTKEDVLPDLPEVVFTPILVDLSNLDEYQEAEAEFLQWVMETKGWEAMLRARKAVGIVRMGALFRLSAEGKAKAMAEIVEERIRAGSKVVVFSRFKGSLAHFNAGLSSDLRQWESQITGDQSAEEKEFNRQRFQNDASVRVIYCTVEAAGVGCDLWAGDTAVFLSLPWSPEQFKQNYSRLEIGGKKNAIEVIVGLGRETSDIEMVEICYQKAPVIASAIAGSDRSKESEALGKILRELK